MKVAVVGAGGGIGQPLALLLKLSPLVDELSLYDVAPFIPGVGVDLSHCSSKASVKAFAGDQMAAALEGCDLVVIPAGVPRKPGMTRDDLFKINAGIIKGICETIAKVCPKAWTAIVTNPVNSTVAIAAEVFKAQGCYDPKKLFGITTLDVVRSQTFIAEIVGCEPMEVNIPVIGGHAGITILPILSQCSPPVLDKLTADQAAALTVRIQNAGTEVVDAKAGAGSATLSESVIECSYVESTLTDVPFFASQVKLGPSGIEAYLPLPAMNETETAGFEALKEELQGSISKGISFVASL